MPATAVWRDDLAAQDGWLCLCCGLVRVSGGRTESGSSHGKGRFGRGHTWSCRDLHAVDVVNVTCEGAEAMRPLDELPVYCSNCCKSCCTVYCYMWRWVQGWVDLAASTGISVNSPVYCCDWCNKHDFLRWFWDVAIRQTSPLQPDLCWHNLCVLCYAALAYRY